MEGIAEATTSQANFLNDEDIVNIDVKYLLIRLVSHFLLPPSQKLYYQNILTKNYIKLQEQCRVFFIFL